MPYPDAVNIDNAFIEEYRDLVIHLSQQGDTRIRPHVMEVSSNGEAYNFERLADVGEPVYKGVSQPGSGSKWLDTAPIDADWSRRVAVPETRNHTLAFEQEDRVQMLVDPQSAYAQAQGMAMKRGWDDLVIAAATGDALDGDGASIPFPAEQVVGDGLTEISYDMVTEVQEKFLENEIDMDVPKVFIIGPKQVRKLLQLEYQISADYVRREALQNLTTYGIVANWMGFTWIMSNRLLIPAAGQLSCLAFTKQAIGLAINQDTFVRIGENPMKQYAIQVFSQWTGGAVRVEDEHIVHVHVADTVTP